MVTFFAKSCILELPICGNPRQRPYVPQFDNLLRGILCLHRWRVQQPTGKDGKQCHRAQNDRSRAPRSVQHHAFPHQFDERVHPNRSPCIGQHLHDNGTPPSSAQQHQRYQDTRQRQSETSSPEKVSGQKEKRYYRRNQSQNHADMLQVEVTPGPLPIHSLARGETVIARSKATKQSPGSASSVH
jgi:hypothetical protein